MGDCFDAAWNDIKDRKGHMTEGGAFVKESKDEDIDNDYQGYPNET